MTSAKAPRSLPVVLRTKPQLLKHSFRAFSEHALASFSGPTTYQFPFRRLYMLAALDLKAVECVFVSPASAIYTHEPLPWICFTCLPPPNPSNSSSHSHLQEGTLWPQRGLAPTVRLPSVFCLLMLSIPEISCSIPASP